MSDLERIKVIISALKSLGHGKQKDIAAKMGYTNESAFSQVVNGKAPLPVGFESRLISLDDRVLNYIPKDLPKEKNTRPKLEAIPLRLADPHGLESTGQKFYTLPDGSEVMQIPVVPVKAWGSYPRGHADPEFYDGFDTITIPVDRLHKGTYIAFEMKGESMVNIENVTMARKSLWPGQKIIGRDLKRELWKYKLHIHSNEAWIIVHRTEGIVVKEIIDHDVDNGFITLHSWNPDKENYPDFTVHLDDVEQILNIVDPFGKMKPY